MSNCILKRRHIKLLIGFRREYMDYNGPMTKDYILLAFLENNHIPCRRSQALKIIYRGGKFKVDKVDEVVG